MLTPLVVVGGGGFGREVIAIMHAINALKPTWNLLGVVDDGDPQRLTPSLYRAGTRLLGTLDDLPSEHDLHAVVAVGLAHARERLVGRLQPRAQFATLIHPDSTVGSGVLVGHGTIVAPGARLSTGIVVGAHVHIDQNASIGHDAVLHDYVRLNPQACISGNVTLRRSVLVGANATVLQGLEVGASSTVGAGAVVVRDCPARSRVKGVPAR